MTNRKPVSIASAAVVIIVCIVGICWTQLRRPPVIDIRQTMWQGKTMGTMYTVRIDDPLSAEQQQDVYDAVERCLAEVNKQLSLFDSESVLSRMNRAGTNAFIMSSELAEVMVCAMDLAQRSHGAFDPTVKPLVSLWGFGPERKSTEDVSPEEVFIAKSKVGWQNLIVEGVEVTKDRADIQVDLGAIAKGYGVDRVALLLQQKNLQNFLVEIGGETRSCGMHGDKPWRIGIQLPKMNAVPGDGLSDILEPVDMALATSGDYQNFYYDKEGHIRSHIIDPRTGYPVDHALASVTVAAPSCMLADGLATALYVLGPEEGTKLLAHYPRTAALFIERTGEKTFNKVFTSGFKELAGSSNVWN